MRDSQKPVPDSQRPPESANDLGGSFETDTTLKSAFDEIQQSATQSAQVVAEPPADGTEDTPSPRKITLWDGRELLLDASDLKFNLPAIEAAASEFAASIDGVIHQTKVVSRSENAAPNEREEIDSVLDLKLDQLILDAGELERALKVSSGPQPYLWVHTGSGKVLRLNPFEEVDELHKLAGNVRLNLYHKIVTPDAVAPLSVTTAEPEPLQDPTLAGVTPSQITTEHVVPAERPIDNSEHPSEMAWIRLGEAVQRMLPKAEQLIGDLLGQSVVVRLKEITKDSKHESIGATVGSHLFYTLDQGERSSYVLIDSRVAGKLATSGSADVLAPGRKLYPPDFWKLDPITKLKELSRQLITAVISSNGTQPTNLTLDINRQQFYPDFDSRWLTPNSGVDIDLEVQAKNIDQFNLHILLNSDALEDFRPAEPPTAQPLPEPVAPEAAQKESSSRPDPIGIEAQTYAYVAETFNELYHQELTPEQAKSILGLLTTDFARQHHFSITEYGPDLFDWAEKVAAVAKNAKQVYTLAEELAEDEKTTPVEREAFLQFAEQVKQQCQRFNTESL